MKSIRCRPRTRKSRNLLGGDVQHEIFDKIISIGYEFESSNLSKLTLLQETEEGGDPVLLNTDTIAKNLPIIHAEVAGGASEAEPADWEDEYTQEFAEEDEEEEEEEEEEPVDQEGLALRLQETVQFDAYTTESLGTNAPVADPNVLFQSLNDIADTTFNRNLFDMCNDLVEAKIALKKAESADELEEDKILHDIKNQLYRFETADGKSYRIHFQTWAENDCSSFCDVEWLFTYFKPLPSSNIVTTTFFNAMKNLIAHLGALESTSGKLVAHFSEEDKEVIDEPETRLLYHYPETNMYYLQTHRVDKPLTVDDICIVPQMTFAADAQYIPHILKELVKDSHGTFKFNRQLANQSFTILERVHKCTIQLFDKYNQDAGYAMFDPTNETVRRIHTYMFLILYKLERYYNAYRPKIKKTPDTKLHVNYFKNFLSVNSRHNNGELYANLKAAISTHIGNDTETINIIRDVMLQPKILETLLLDPKNVRKRAFEPSNILEKTDKNYGNPYYSLASFLQFFEDPVSEEKVDGINDWFIQASIDIYSTTMAIQNHVVLIEYRSFKHMIRSYASSFQNSAIDEELKKGICNTRNEDAGYLSIRALKQIIPLYESQAAVATTTTGGKKRRKTVKDRA